MQHLTWFQPFTHSCPCTDIHTLLSLDLLHEVIKGTFKEHLVTWVNEYLHVTHGEAHTLEIIHNIDWLLGGLFIKNIHYWSLFRILSVPSYVGLRRFSDGRNFEQWTGDDLKALMKVCFLLMNQGQPYQHETGLHCCYCWSCSDWNGAMSDSVHGPLLHILLKCDHNNCPEDCRRPPWPVPQPLMCIHWCRCPLKHILAMSACTYSLPNLNSPIWIAQQTLFIDYRVKTHQGCQRTMVMLKSVQGTHTDATDNNMIG